jgi:cytochrome c oxidase subunit IV
LATLDFDTQLIVSVIIHVAHAAVVAAAAIVHRTIFVLVLEVIITDLVFDLDRRLVLDDAAGLDT